MHNQGLRQVFFWQCPGTSKPSAAQLMASLYLCSSGSSAAQEASWGPLKGAVSAQVAFQGSETGNEGISGRNYRK